ncbi:MAG: hypothetical protein HQL54_06530 [Magnetococcales bacterium]|nr:hypothetical protein [Magnetococcales bacterium]
MRQLIALFFCLSLIGIVAPDTGMAQELVVTGMADLEEFRDRGRARDEALKDALVKAVEQGLGVQIQAESQVSNGMLGRDDVLSRTGGFVKSHQIIREWVDSDLFYVKVKVLLQKGSVADDKQGKGMVKQCQHRPRMVLIVDGAERAQTREMEGVFFRALKKQGFPSVDPEVVRSSLARQAAAMDVAGYEKAGRSVALQYGGEVLVKVAVESQQQGGGSYGDMKLPGTVRSIITARAVRVDSGEVIASADDAISGGARRMSSSARRMANKIAQKLGNSIWKSWQSQCYDKDVLTLILTGKDVCAKSLQFGQYIKDKMRGVKAMHIRACLGASATVELEYQGKPQAFITKLKSMRGLPNRYSLVGFTANQVSLELK